MNKKNKTPEFQKLESTAENIAVKLGLILYDIEWTLGAQGQVLRIYIDRAEGGISVDHCADFSRELNDYLDANDPLPGSHYSLEVSSPGVDRPLTRLWHFEKVIGKKITLKTERSLEVYGCEDSRYRNSKSLTDQMLAVEGNSILVKVGDSQVKIPLEDIEKARLTFEFNENKQNSKNIKNKNKKSK